MGKQAESKRRNLSCYKFSRAMRIADTGAVAVLDDAILDPSPCTSSMGKQVKSKTMSAPVFGFGTSTRDHQNRLTLCMAQGPGAAAAKRGHSLPHPILPVEREALRYS